MEFLTQIFDRQAKKTADRRGEYRTLLRKAVRADGPLGPRDAERLAAVVDELRLSPAEVKADADVLRRHDELRPLADQLPGVVADLAAARDRVEKHEAERSRVVAELDDRSRELQVPVYELDQRRTALKFAADELYQLEGGNAELLGITLPDPPPAYRPRSDLEMDAEARAMNGAGDARPYWVRLASAMRGVRADRIRRRLHTRQPEGAIERAIAEGWADGAADLVGANMPADMLPAVLADADDERAAMLARIGPADAEQEPAETDAPGERTDRFASERHDGEAVSRPL